MYLFLSLCCSRSRADKRVWRSVMNRSEWVPSLHKSLFDLSLNAATMYYWLTAWALILGFITPIPFGVCQFSLSQCNVEVWCSPNLRQSLHLMNYSEECSLPAFHVMLLSRLPIICRGSQWVQANKIRARFVKCKSVKQWFLTVQRLYKQLMDCGSFAKTASKNRTWTTVEFWWWNQAIHKPMLMKYMGVDEVKRGKERKIRQRQKENRENE